MTACETERVYYRRLSQFFLWLSEAGFIFQSQFLLLFWHLREFSVIILARFYSRTKINSIWLEVLWFPHKTFAYACETFVFFVSEHKVFWGNAKILQMWTRNFLGERKSSYRFSSYLIFFSFTMSLYGLRSQMIALAMNLSLWRLVLTSDGQYMGTILVIGWY